jgi:hypothetical protein
MATITSLCALTVSIYQAYMQRKQTYASVMPSLIIYTSSDSNANTFEFNVDNKGVGPAIVEEAEFELNGQKFKTIERMIFEKLKITDFGNSTLWKNRILSANESVRILSFAGKSGKAMIDTFQQNPHPPKLSIKLKYASIYDEKWVLEWDNYSYESKIKKIE